MRGLRIIADPEQTLQPEHMSPPGGLAWLTLIKQA